MSALDLYYTEARGLGPKEPLDSNPLRPYRLAGPGDMGLIGCMNMSFKVYGEGLQISKELRVGKHHASIE